MWNPGSVLVWSRDVARSCRCSLSVAGPFVRRCLTSLTMLPFPYPAHRTGYTTRGSQMKNNGKWVSVIALSSVDRGRWRGSLDGEYLIELKEI